jgi:DNA polymerase-3 subunit epsilon
MLSSLLRWWYRRRTSAAFMRDYLDAAAPSRRTPATDAGYLVLDLEMTGLQPASDRIVSMGWVHVQAGRIRMRTARHVLLSIDGSVAESATVHHLRDQDLSGGCSEREALRLLLRALQGRVLVAHHAHRQARDGELRLDALRAAYNLPRYPAHNALSDALATAELFLALLQHQSDETPLRALLHSRL